MEKGTTAKVAEIRPAPPKASSNKLPSQDLNATKAAVPAPKPKSPLKKVASVVALPIEKKWQEADTSAKNLFNLRGLRPQQLRRKILALSFALMVLLPSLLGATYFLLIASDRYSSTIGFSVRGMDGSSAGGDFLGALTGLASVGTTTTDSFILMDYLEGREVVERLSKDEGILSHLSEDSVDFIYRLDQSMPIEELVEYWQSMITTSFDNTSSIIEVEVQAFSPEMTERIASRVLSYGSELVNTLSQNARRDAVKFAEEEVRRAELRLKMIRMRMKNFRSAESSIDPTKNAEVQIELIAGLEKQLLDTRSRLATLVGTIDESSPTIRQLRKQEEVLIKQILNKRDEISGRNPTPLQQATEGADRLSSLSALLANYEELVVEQEFAQQAYTAALAGLERSRAEADRQQRYLAVFKPPSKPQEAIYPRRLINSLILFLGLLAIWALVTVIAYSIRDHLK
ncbi:capsular polysaccharide transport system permease protein [Pseudovibrio ascidiaceicola]|uniref:Capsular polysaccharide transport system permease protein n=1 Tax=Pseudovibrio ascidiaceicola TaxID=285279 RepID=A0A1I3ZUZ7_9HYPH|nr:lipopolysaccharide biosynthesis protein [Pseudovibrio ascidiaceicola]SFK47531.1 capsular polysaccharide transport system permease protein [Pseudovibrio ascidiaceicola]